MSISQPQLSHGGKAQKKVTSALKNRLYTQIGIQIIFSMSHWYFAWIMCQCTAEEIFAAIVQSQSSYESGYCMLFRVYKAQINHFGKKKKKEFLYLIWLYKYFVLSF